ncbi:MAG: succinylglutamate desuccinylase/aspartoacylase family protein [Candidatus Natronoplasma sp.]
MKKTLITAGVHGAEIGSVLIAREIKGWIESRNIEEIEVIPEVNLEAVENKQRENPEDGKDLNRIFPGDENGTKSERIAHQTFQKAIEFDRIIDLHTYGKDSWCVPYMLTNLRKDYNIEFCKNLGLNNAVQTGGTGGQMFLEASKLEIPSMIIEAGGAERYRGELGRVKDAVLSYVLDDYEKGKKEEPTFYHHYERLSPGREGYFKAKREPGEEVDKGDIIGELDGEPIKADFTGFILGIKTDSYYDPEDQSLAAIAKKEE